MYPHGVLEALNRERRKGKRRDREKEGWGEREREVQSGQAEFLPTLLLSTLLNNFYDKKRIYPLLLVLKPRPREAQGPAIREWL